MESPKCNHCLKPLEPKPGAPHLAQGFYDQDTDENTCWGCKPLHYKKKTENGLEGLYSEMPILL